METVIWLLIEALLIMVSRYQFENEGREGDVFVIVICILCQILLDGGAEGWL